MSRRFTFYLGASRVCRTFLVFHRLHLVMFCVTITNIWWDISRRICLPLNISEKLHWQHLFEKLGQVEKPLRFIRLRRSYCIKNSYPRDFVDKCIKIFLDRVLTQKFVVSTVTKKYFMVVLPYLGKLSFQIRTRINHVMKNKLPTAIFELYSRANAS